MKSFANWFLSFAERLYLEAHGWEYLGQDVWKQPSDYPYREKMRRTGHAVNSQKTVNGNAARYGRRDR